MNFHKIWGQGQLFAFSALDGPSCASSDFTGYLSGDRIGIRFFSKVKRELAIVNLQGRNLIFDAVTGDYISFRFDGQESMRILYALPHLIVGNVCGEAQAVVFTEGICQLQTDGETEIQDTGDGEYTALRRWANRFAFAFGHSREKVLSLSAQGIALSLDELENQKKAFYETFCKQAPQPYQELAAKCLSVMKTQLYSPEGNFTSIWSTPDRLPHRHLWLWDSVFHSLGHRHIDTNLAESLLDAVWANQSPEGFIPHMAGIDFHSQITQPPVIAWGAWQLYQTSGHREFLNRAYENNKRFLSWCRANRRLTEKELYTWNTTDDVNCRCDESGMDNSPRFDIHEHLYAIDFSCFMANEARTMAKIAKELGNEEDALLYQEWFETISRSINETLWSQEDGFYFDCRLTGEHHKVYSVASFLPLFAGVCSASQAKSLVGWLQDPESFATPFPIPSISQKDETFGSDMWRGPVWINYNYMICQGLRAYGYEELALEIIDKTIYFMNDRYHTTGTIYEFYDCTARKAPSALNRKGLPLEPYNIDLRVQAIRDYGWSCTLLLDWLLSE